MGSLRFTMAARQAWLLALAVTCTAVLGLTEQAEAGVSTGVLEDPPIHEGGSFKQIPGTPAGTAVYKEKRMPNMAAWTALCDADFDCAAYSWDASFNECKLLKKDQQVLEMQTMKATDEVAKEQGQAAEKQAAEMEQAEEKEKKKEEEDKKEIENTPVAQLEAEKQPREIYQQAVKKEREAKKMVQDILIAQKEVKEKVVGTQTVERIAKRHVQESGAKLAAEHKVFSAAMLNLEEQVMIRDDRNSKEVLLAKGAKEEAEVKYDEIHTAQLNAVRMADKALGMNKAAQEAEIKASQQAVHAQLVAEESSEDLKKATEHYKAAELKQKNDEDAKKRADAMTAKTYLRMRDMIKEREARAKQAGSMSFEEMDAKAKKSCHEQQQEMKKAEVRIRQELNDEIGKEQRAIAEKKIKEMTEETEQAVDKRINKEEKQAVAQAKERADASVGDLMEALDQHKLLGEVKDATQQEAKAVTKAAQAKLDGAKVKVASAEAAVKDASEKSDAARKKQESLEKELDEAKDDAKSASSKAAEKMANGRIKQLLQKIADAKEAVKASNAKEDAAAKILTKNKIAVADAEA